MGRSTSKAKWSKRVGAAVGGLVFLGAGTLVARAVRKRIGAASTSAAEANGDPFELYATRFRYAHEVLRRNLQHFDTLIDTGAGERAPDALGELIELYARFLVVHHESEDLALFPALRRASALRTVDAGHLDHWSDEHRSVNAAGRALERAGASVRRGDMTAIPEVKRLAGELAALLEPHLAAEEELITAPRLRELLSPLELRDVEIAGRKLGQGAELAVFFLHSLRPDEQKQVFGPSPWMFRKVILPVLGATRYRPIRDVWLSPSTAL